MNESLDQFQDAEFLNRMHELLRLLHYHIRRGHSYDAMKVAQEMVLRKMAVQFWNELEICSTEETSDLLAILTVDVLYKMHRGGKTGVQGDLHMAQIGSVTEGKTARYADFRKKFDEEIRKVLNTSVAAFSL